jgi:hypothetical protein
VAADTVSCETFLRWNSLLTGQSTILRAVAKEAGEFRGASRQFQVFASSKLHIDRDVPECHKMSCNACCSNLKNTIRLSNQSC